MIVLLCTLLVLFDCILCGLQVCYVHRTVCSLETWQEHCETAMEKNITNQNITTSPIETIQKPT